MTYRDDRDALHARTQALEAEVATLREEQERMRVLHERELELTRAGREMPRDCASERQQHVNPRAAFWMVAVSALLFTGVQTLRATGGRCGSHRHGPPPSYVVSGPR